MVIPIPAEPFPPGRSLEPRWEGVFALVEDAFIQERFGGHIRVFMVHYGFM